MTIITSKYADAEEIDDIKKQYRYRFLMLFTMISGLFFLFLFIYFNRYYFLFILFICIFYWYFPPFDERVPELCEEAVDTGSSLQLKKNGFSEEIFYDNIKNIYHQRAKFSINLSIAVIELKIPSRIGDEIYLVSWKHKAFSKDDEILSFIERLKKRMRGL